MTVYFTSDTHFGHDAIRRLADRPYASLQAMDDALIANWNAVVKADDTVWHLGDFAHKSAPSPADYRQRLNGCIHLITGNHDRHTVRDHAGLFASIQDMAEVQVSGRTLILCHYPLREWDKAWRGAYHLHGHVHGRLDDEPFGFSLDAGVDSHEYAPIDITRITRLLADRVNPFTDAEDRATQSRRQSAAKRLRAATELG
jgi:calcineurin-like phosphoesterase family protein